jgi:hypothetical protein
MFNTDGKLIGSFLKLIFPEVEPVFRISKEVLLENSGYLRNSNN